MSIRWKYPLRWRGRRLGAKHLPCILGLTGTGILSLGVVPPPELLEEARKPVQIEVANDVATIQWFAHPDVFYFVEGSPDLTTWITAKLLKDTAPEGSLTLATSVANPKAFYRLDLEGDPDAARLREDSDGDGIINLLEVEAGWDAYAAEVPTDSDSDGIPDYFEQFHFGTLDHEGNYVAVTGGLTLAEAYANTTDPNKVDSDGDGFPDAYEIANNLDPNYNQSRDNRILDTDGDGLTDWMESLSGTRADLADSDGDGLDDGSDGWALEAELLEPRVSENYVLIDLSSSLPYPTEEDELTEFKLPQSITFQIDDYGGILMSEITDPSGDGYELSTTVKYYDFGEGTVYDTQGTNGTAALPSDLDFEYQVSPGNTYIYHEIFPYLTRSGQLVFNGYIHEGEGWNHSLYLLTWDTDPFITEHYTTAFRSSYDLRDVAGGFPSAEIAPDEDLWLDAVVPHWNVESGFPTPGEDIGNTYAIMDLHWFINFGLEYSDNPYQFIEGNMITGSDQGAEYYMPHILYSSVIFTVLADSNDYTIYDSYLDENNDYFTTHSPLPLQDYWPDLDPNLENETEDHFSGFNPIPAVSGDRGEVIGKLFDGAAYWNPSTRQSDIVMLSDLSTFFAPNKASDHAIIIETTFPATAPGSYVEPNVYINGTIKPVTALLGPAADHWDQIYLHDINSHGSIVGVGEYSGPDVTTPEKRAFLLLKMDVDIDSDNTNGADAPDRSSAEEALEDDDEEPGKLIGVNNGDRDFDNIPDYADGFDGETLSDVNFTPLVLEMPDGIDIDKLKVKLTYSASDPAQITVETESAGALHSDGNRYGGNSQWTRRGGEYHELPSSGKLRIWTKDASEARSSASILSQGDGDFVPSDTEIPFEELNGDTTERTITLYVEGVKPSSFVGGETIEFKLGIDSGGSVTYYDVDEVRTTIVDAAFRDYSGDAFVGRDDYTFSAGDYSYNGSLSDAGSPVIFSMKADSTGVVQSLTIPTAPQDLNEILNYYKERTQNPYPLATASVTPETSQQVFNQEVTVNSDQDKGFFYLDAMAGQQVGTEVPLGTAGVSVFEKRIIDVGIRSIHQRSSDGSNDFDAPELTAAQVQSIEDYLNSNIFAQANVEVVLNLLDSAAMNYDVIGPENQDGSPNQKLDVNAQFLFQGLLISESEIIDNLADDGNVEFMVFVVNDIDDASVDGPADLGIRAATKSADAPDPAGRFIYYSMNGLDVGNLDIPDFSDTLGHELAHAMGCPHPFEYSVSGNGFPFDDDYDPENLMSYFTDGVKLRFYQWIEINPISNPAQ